MSESTPAKRAVQRRAREIRRYYEKGGEKATIDSNILPLLHELAPSIDFVEDESERLQDYPIEWATRKKFKKAYDKFRKEAKEAGYAIPAVSQNWPSFDPARPTPSQTAETSESRQSEPYTISSSDTTMTDSPAPDGNGNEGVAPTPSSSGVPASKSSSPANSSVRTSIENQQQQGNSQLPNDPWPLLNALVPDLNTPPAWQALQRECLLYGCDFADVKFRCEFRLKNEKKDTADGIRAFAADWIRICPEALDFLDGDVHGDSTMKAHIQAYRVQNPRNVPLRVERDSSSRSRLFSENPEQDRRERGFVNHLKEPYDGWDVIRFEEDPDDSENGAVEGKIMLAISGWLDVSLPSLNEENPDKERHILVRESDYPEAASRFSKTTEGNNRTFKKSADKALLRNKTRTDFKVVSYSSAKQERKDLWPRTYTTAYLDNGDNNSSLHIWARTAWHYFGKSTIDKEINDWREEVGQQRISIAK